MTMSPARRRECDRDDALECCLNVVERLVFHLILTDDANSDGNACKSILSFSLREWLELRSMIELRCHRLSFINRWWNAAGVFEIVQLFNHKRFEHSAFKRCEPCPADLLINKSRIGLGKNLGVSQAMRS